MLGIQKSSKASLQAALFPSLALILFACGSEERRESLNKETIRAISAQSLQSERLPELTGLDPVKDWFRLLRLSRSNDPEVNLILPGVTRLSDTEAQIIGKLSAQRVFLRDLQELRAPQARLLTSYAQERRIPYSTGAPGRQLYLDGLKTLDRETAEILVAAGPEILSLDGLTKLDLEVARVLAGTVSSLSLDGLKEVSPELARVLATWSSVGEQVFISLRGLRALDPQVAEELSRTKGWMLDLSGLVELSAEAALKLGQLQVPCLALSGLKNIPPATADVMKGWDQKFLVLDGLETLDTETRAALDAASSALSLRSLED